MARPRIVEQLAEHTIGIGGIVLETSGESGHMANVSCEFASRRFSPTAYSDADLVQGRPRSIVPGRTCP